MKAGIKLGLCNVYLAALVAAAGLVGCEDETNINHEPDNITIETNAAPRIDVRQDGSNNLMRVDLRDDEPAATDTNAPAQPDNDTIRIYQDGNDNRLEIRALEEMRNQRLELEARGW